MKKWTSILLSAVVLLALFPAVMMAEEGVSYAEEKPLRTYRGHSGDRGEVQESFEALLAALAAGEDSQAFLAEGVEAQSFQSYFDKLSGLKEFSFKAVRFALFYEVKDKAVFENYRALAVVTYQAKDGDKTIQYMDQLALAKQGREATDWKIWDVLWNDAGIDISDQALFQLEPPAKGEEICIVETDKGEMKLRLFPDRAPKAVENFKALAEKGFYNEMPYNRVYDNFMIQIGALDGSGKEEESSFGGFFEDEFVADLFHFRGAVSMGNAGPNTNGNQFFMVQKPVASEDDLALCSLPENVKEKYREIGGLPHLDGRYSIFGQVYEGLELIDLIARQEADDDGMPLKDPIRILSIRFEKAE